MYNRLIKSISNSYRYPLRNLNSLLTKLFHLPSKYIKYACTILYIWLHVPSTARRALGSCMPVLLLGYARSFPVAPCCVFLIQCKLAHLPLAWWINRLYGHLVPGGHSVLVPFPSPARLPYDRGLAAGIKRAAGDRRV